MDDGTLHLAEVLHPNGQVHFRYQRYLAPDGKRWIRHGPFRAYREDGTLESEGQYEHGLESGLWRDYHDNGQKAAEGEYVRGNEHGVWHFWSADGAPEADVRYDNGEEVSEGSAS